MQSWCSSTSWFAARRSTSRERAAAVAIRRLGKTFREGDVVALADIDLEIQPREAAVGEIEEDTKGSDWQKEELQVEPAS